MRRSRPTALGQYGFRLTVVGVVATLVGVGCVLWVVSQTDTGMMCESPYTAEDSPAACSVYGPAFWLLEAGFAALIVGLALCVFAGVITGRAKPGANH